MKNTKKLIDIFIIAMFVFLCASTALRTVALFTAFNGQTMHFEDSITFVLSAVFAAGATVLFLSALFLVPKQYRLAPNCSAPEAFIPSGILSVALLFMSFAMFARAYAQRGIFASGVALVIKHIPTVLGIFALLSAAFFFLNILITKRTAHQKAVLGMCTVVFLALYGAYLYFSKDIHPTNSPNKIIDQMAYFSSAIFFLFETRISLGRDLWRGYISFGLISTLLTGYSAIPALIYHFASSASISNSVTESVLTLTLFLYILTKLLLTRKLPSDDQCKMASAIERIAAKREGELAERRSAALSRDYNSNEENDAQDTDASGSDTNESGEAEGQIAFEIDPPSKADE